MTAELGQLLTHAVQQGPVISRPLRRVEYNDRLIRLLYPPKKIGGVVIGEEAKLSYGGVA